MDTSASDQSPAFNWEIHFLIAKFLEAGPCHQAAKVLIQEVEQSGSSKYEHIKPDHLANLLHKLLEKSKNEDEEGKIIPVKSLLSSLFKDATVKRNLTLSHPFRNALSPLRHSGKTNALIQREIFGLPLSHKVNDSFFFSKLRLQCSSLGHLTAVYCVLFDVTGKFIFTGADDQLVKIWSGIDGRLLASLRGNSAEITDLAVNPENTLLASSSCDRYIRIWCLGTGAPVATLSGHTSNVTSIFFCPIPRSRSRVRYLASTSTDGSVAFWAYCEEPGKKAEFQSKPTIYLERMRPGHAQMICSSFSPGGTFMAAGSADNNVRVYHMMEADGPKRVLEVQPHTERVDSISWAHRGLRFISGSKDGTALVWKYDFGDNWRFTKIQSWKPAPGEPAIVIDPKLRPRVTMIGWNADDSLVLTAVSNHLVKVWNPDNGQLVRILRDHTDEVYVIEPHPIYPRVVCTAGHDGHIFVWDIGLPSDPDIYSGIKVFQYKNVLEEAQGHGAVFDLKWSPDGLSLAATDSHGHVLIFSSSQNDKFKRLPKELFFHTDYRPLSTDAITNTVLDEQTQVLPHLMPPPFLVNMDGAPYPAPLQRLVPGRENCKDEQLIPNVAFAPGGQAEVIEGIPAQVPGIPAVVNANARSIDAMIAQLVAEQGVNEQGQAGALERRESMPAERRGIGNRRSGDIEGVRQSRGNWQPGGLGGVRQRNIIPPLSPALLARSEEIRHAIGEEEEAYYQERKSKKLQSPGTSGAPLVSPTDSVTSQEIKSRRLRRLAAQAAERRQQEEVQRQNDAQGIPRPNPPQQEISQPQIMPRRRSSGLSRNSGSRSQRTPRNSVHDPTQVPRPARRPARRRRRLFFQVRRDGEEENGHSSFSSQDSSFSSSDVSGTSSSESEFTDSDWGGGGTAVAGPSTSSPRKGPAATGEGTRKRRRGGGGGNSGSSKENEENGSSDEDYKEPKAGPSTQVTKTIKKEPVKSRPSRQLRKVVDESQLLDGISPQFRPSEWFGALRPCKFPYWPQIGDDLLYFRQGHERYIKTIQKDNVYTLEKKVLKSLPWITNPKLEAQIPCRVISVKFEINPPRLASLKLGIVDDNGVLTGAYLHVTYHDMKDVVDFLILKQLYDKSMRHNWSVNDRFRCLIGNVWWLGTIKAVQPHSPEFPNSKFLLYKVKWDNHDLEVLSPWDIEVIPDAFEIPHDSRENGISATDEDIRAGLYEVNSRDWPPYGHQEAECDRISLGIGDVMTLSIAEAFLTPVDLNTYPDYTYAVAYPMDLATIKARLDNRFYRRIEALKFDIKYIAINTETFNVSRSEIVKKARIIRDLCLRICESSDLDVSAEYHQLQSHFHWASTDIDVEERRRKGREKKGSIKTEPEAEPSTSARTSNRLRDRKTPKIKSRGRPKDVERHRPWQERCKDLLTNLWECRDSAPFREPVDPTEYADYYHQIDTPMDLQSIKEDLLGGNYQSPLQFSKDVQLIFSNSKQYNTDKHSQIHVMTLRLKSIFDVQITPILEDWKGNKSRRGKSSRNKPNLSSPLKGRPKRHATVNGSHVPSPRKNPSRTAASKNPYVHKNASSGEDEDLDEGADMVDTSSEEEFVADEENYRDRRKKRRRRSDKQKSSTPPPPQPSTSRAGGSRTKLRDLVKLEPVIKEEPSSEEEEDEPEAEAEAEGGTSSEEEEEAVESEVEQKVTPVASPKRKRRRVMEPGDSEDYEEPKPSTSSKAKTEKRGSSDSIATRSSSRRTSSRRTSAVSTVNGSCNSSVPSSPRKNPKRSAARRNPYLNNRSSSQEEEESAKAASSEDEFVPVEEEEAVRGRRRSSILSMESHSSAMSGSNSRKRGKGRVVFGKSSSPEPFVRRSTRPRREPKRARLFSEDEDEAEADEDRPITRFRGKPSKNYVEGDSTGEEEDSD